MSHSHYSGGGRRDNPRDGGRPSGGGQGSRDSNSEIKEALRSEAKVSYRVAGRIRPALLDKDAQAAAERLGEVTITQLRRFFEQVGAIKRRVQADPNLADDEILAQVAFLKAAAVYAAGRDRRNKPVLDFIVRNANGVEGRESFLDFHRHFEAVIAFHKVYGKREGN